VEVKEVSRRKTQPPRIPIQECERSLDLNGQSDKEKVSAKNRKRRAFGKRFENLPMLKKDITRIEVE